jgi:hypothetical protein
LVFFSTWDFALLWCGVKKHMAPVAYIYFIETVSENGKRLGCCHRTSPWAPPIRCREKDKALLASFLATHRIC